MNNLIYRRVQWHTIPPYWMKSAYFDYRINSAMYVVFPLNYIVQFVWFLNLAWCKFKSKPSWIDKKALEYAGYMSKKYIPHVPHKGPDCTNRTTTPITFKSYDGTKSTLPVNTLPDREWYG